jgi:hypothetical protein
MRTRNGAAVYGATAAALRPRGGARGVPETVDGAVRGVAPDLARVALRRKKTDFLPHMREHVTKIPNISDKIESHG